MTLPDIIPNSPEFAQLHNTEKLRILANRWTKRLGPRTIPTLTELHEPEEPPKEHNWYYEKDTLALQHWGNYRTGTYQINIALVWVE